jgi:hypothetical protein
MVGVSRVKEQWFIENRADAIAYDPDTGLFTRVIPTQRQLIGDVVGYKSHAGYIRMGFKEGGVTRKILAHRAAFFYMEGAFPPAYVDHINGCRSDNRWVNLRHATRKENNRNRSPRRNSTSKFLGVSKHVTRRTTKDGVPRSSERWAAQIGVVGDKRWLGSFKTEREAAIAYDREAIKAYKEYASTNILENPWVK